MGRGPSSTADGDLDALADLFAHLQHVEQLLTHLPPGGEPHLDEQGRPLTEVFAAAHAAAAHVADFVTGQKPYIHGSTRIALGRHPGGVTLCMDRAAGPKDITAFIGELHKADARLLCCAELLGLLFHLSLTWATSGFALPVVLRSLRDHAPRILALGAALIEPEDPQSWQAADDDPQVPGLFL